MKRAVEKRAVEKRAPASVAPPASGEIDLLPPRDLAAHRFDLGKDSFAVLEFTLADLTASRPPSNLSVAEQDVMSLVLGGKNNVEIARTRGTSVRTVANQVGSLFKKLGIGSRAELYARVARSAIRP